MAHKTFISYKYSEACTLRDDIIDSLGKDATYYKGETSDSPDLTDTTTDNIKCKLRDMIYDTSVTIVIISPSMTQSQWIDWELEYSLKEITRADRTSRSNGIVGVIMKHNGGYGWIESKQQEKDGCSVVYLDGSKLYGIIKNNRHNLKNPEYCCDECQSWDKLSGSYISLIREEVFLKKPNFYIENAYEKSKNISKFNMIKTNK
ncbi:MULTISPECIES: TIR domain-containing protein [Bacillus cereus group]|uniref:TIR domain-containing protein n=1 Tax=Bacillus cereus group TaxID=86661 RepID=UPI000BEB4CA7|nr:MULTISPECIES: TIR domain-containing protein [Bacillus cereus group]PEE68083.1 hypothetical protein COM73_25705 [Bacillus thuringiensis]PER23678.1 hypothetical protein CN476_16660 [Bacillus cereus]